MVREKKGRGWLPNGIWWSKFLALLFYSYLLTMSTLSISSVLIAAYSFPAPKGMCSLAWADHISRTKGCYRKPFGSIPAVLTHPFTWTGAVSVGHAVQAHTACEDSVQLHRVPLIFGTYHIIAWVLPAGTMWIQWSFSAEGGTKVDMHWLGLLGHCKEPKQNSES